MQWPTRQDADRLRAFVLGGWLPDGDRSIRGQYRRSGDALFGVRDAARGKSSGKSRGRRCPNSTTTAAGEVARSAGAPTRSSLLNLTTAEFSAHSMQRAREACDVMEDLGRAYRHPLFT